MQIAGVQTKKIIVRTIVKKVDNQNNGTLVYTRHKYTEKQNTVDHKME